MSSSRKPSSITTPWQLELKKRNKPGWKRRDNVTASSSIASDMDTTSRLCRKKRLERVLSRKGFSILRNIWGERSCSAADLFDQPGAATVCRVPTLRLETLLDSLKQIRDRPITTLSTSVFKHDTTMISDFDPQPASVSRFSISHLFPTSRPLDDSKRLFDFRFLQLYFLLSVVCRVSVVFVYFLRSVNPLYSSQIKIDSYINLFIDYTRLLLDTGSIA
jgi:hypothetical protein